VSPRDTFTVGDEFDLDRLRIYIHAIKVEDGTLHRGAAEAKDIRRIFARPVHLTPEQRRERRAELGLPPPKPRRRPYPREATRGPAPRQGARPRPAGRSAPPPGRRPPPSRGRRRPPS
jgi:hypothetical protein